VRSGLRFRANAARHDLIVAVARDDGERGVVQADGVADLVLLGEPLLVQPQRALRLLGDVVAAAVDTLTQQVTDFGPVAVGEVVDLAGAVVVVLGFLPLFLDILYMAKNRNKKIVTSLDFQLQLQIIS
jgi:hypothetical protein